MDTDARLERLETMMDQQLTLTVALRGITERLAMKSLDVDARMVRMEARLIGMETTLTAIKDLLERGNGH